MRMVVRVVGVVAGLLGLTIGSAATAQAGAYYAITTNERGTVEFIAYSDGSKVLRLRDTNCGWLGHTTGYWLWENGDGVLREFTDPTCQDGAETRNLNAPWGSHGIYIQMCDKYQGVKNYCTVVEYAWF